MSEVIKELRMKKEIWISVILLAFTVFPLRAQNVHIVGAMKNVMRKGELFATIDIDLSLIHI